MYIVRYTEIILIRLTLNSVKFNTELLPTFLRLPMTHLQCSIVTLKRKNLGVLKDCGLSHCFHCPSTINNNSKLTLSLGKRQMYETWVQRFHGYSWYIFNTIILRNGEISRRSCNLYGQYLHDLFVSLVYFF